MTDTELNALEKAANIAKGQSGEKDFFGMNPELVIFYAKVSPETILDLIAELRQARGERDWIAGKYADAFNALCRPDRMTVAKALTMAKEATCSKN